MKYDEEMVLELLREKYGIRAKAKKAKAKTKAEKDADSMIRSAVRGRRILFEGEAMKDRRVRLFELAFREGLAEAKRKSARERNRKPIYVQARRATPEELEEPASGFGAGARATSKVHVVIYRTRRPWERWSVRDNEESRGWK